MNEIIQTYNLTKHHGNFHAVDGISLNVRRGEIYGFLGLNGAGKTTTIRMLLGMVRPTKRYASLFGKKVAASSSELWRDVGYLVEVPYSYPELTVGENLEIIRRLRRIPDKKAVDIIMNKLNIGTYSDRKAKHLSLGNAQRLGLAKALLHNPKILILDEPTNGLDPAGIVEIRELLQDIAFNKGVTIFISSHILSEMSKIATRIGIIHKGKLIQEVDTNKLNSLRYKHLVLNTHNQSKVKEKLLDNGYPAILSKEGFLEIRNEKAVDHPEHIANILTKEGYPPTLLKVEEEDLEAYFLRIIGVDGGIGK